MATLFAENSFCEIIGTPVCKSIVQKSTVRYGLQSNLRTKDTLIGKFKSFVLCREVVLFSEVQNVLEP